MKPPFTLHRRIATTIATAVLFSPRLFAGDAGAAPERIGIYDSRAIAYAHFWSDSHQRQLTALAKDARQARSSGDTNRFAELQAELKGEQERNHLQVFSTAPVDEVLAGMSNHLALVQRETSVTRLVSKWDEPALKQVPRATRIDVTDRLLDNFKLTEKQMKVVADLRKKPPLPLEKARQLVREGKL